MLYAIRKQRPVLIDNREHFISPGQRTSPPISADTAITGCIRFSETSKCTLQPRFSTFRLWLALFKVAITGT